MAGDLLLRQKGLDEKGKALASQVCTSARRATAIVNDLLDLARCNLGTGIPVYPEEVELNPDMPHRDRGVANRFPGGRHRL